MMWRLLTRATSVNEIQSTYVTRVYTYLYTYYSFVKRTSIQAAILIFLTRRERNLITLKMPEVALGIPDAEECMRVAPARSNIRP